MFSCSTSFYYECPSIFSSLKQFKKTKQLFLNPRTKDDWSEEESGGYGGGSNCREAAPDGAGGGGSVSATRGHGTNTTKLQNIALEAAKT